ncbi:hypothetical protein F9817_08540 [Vibrio sp. CAIM 722]|uniref:Methyl-accepting chemotaxis protein n=1 Tax=Vibrio eleionomae TaxID=2653505 RepID=A0A7X4LJP4_9VIBR|nr:hypothetical protein [Vibrio eleionomae]MZI93243.1 hypothetical protein [Vibrio eleionomae]
MKRFLFLLLFIVLPSVANANYKVTGLYSYSPNQDIADACGVSVGVVFSSISCTADITVGSNVYHVSSIYLYNGNTLIYASYTKNSSTSGSSVPIAYISSTSDALDSDGDGVSDEDEAAEEGDASDDDTSDLEDDGWTVNDDGSVEPQDGICPDGYSLSLTLCYADSDDTSDDSSGDTGDDSSDDSSGDTSDDSSDDSSDVSSDNSDVVSALDETTSAVNSVKTAIDDASSDITNAVNQASSDNSEKLDALNQSVTAGSGDIVDAVQNNTDTLGEGISSLDASIDDLSDQMGTLLNGTSEFSNPTTNGFSDSVLGDALSSAETELEETKAEYQDLLENPPDFLGSTTFDGGSYTGLTLTVKGQSVDFDLFDSLGSNVSLIRSVIIFVATVSGGLIILSAGRRG